MFGIIFERFGTFEAEKSVKNRENSVRVGFGKIADFGVRSRRKCVSYEEVSLAHVIWLDRLVSKSTTVKYFQSIVHCGGCKDS